MHYQSKQEVKQCSVSTWCGIRNTSVRATPILNLSSDASKL